MKNKLCEQYEVEVPILIENVFHTGENIFFLNDYESSSVVFLEYLNMLEYYRDPEYNSECEAYVYLGLISEHSDEKRKAEKYFKKARKISKERTDYPIYAEQVAKAVQSKECESGILICKTGFGMTIVANKFKGIRCAPCYDEETAKQAKEHSNVNVLALPAAYVSTSKAIQIMRVWVASEFLGGRYSERLQMIADVEKENMK